MPSKETTLQPDTWKMCNRQLLLQMAPPTRHAGDPPSRRRAPTAVLLLQVLHGAQGAQAASRHDAHTAAHSLTLLHAAAGDG